MELYARRLPLTFFSGERVLFLSICMLQLCLVESCYSWNIGFGIVRHDEFLPNGGKLQLDEKLETCKIENAKDRNDEEFLLALNMQK